MSFTRFELAEAAACQPEHLSIDAPGVEMGWNVAGRDHPGWCHNLVYPCRQIVRLGSKVTFSTGEPAMDEALAVLTAKKVKRGDTFTLSLLDNAGRLFVAVGVSDFSGVSKVQGELADAYDRVRAKA